MIKIDSPKSMQSLCKDKEMLVIQWEIFPTDVAGGKSTWKLLLGKQVSKFKCIWPWTKFVGISNVYMWVYTRGEYMWVYTRGEDCICDHSTLFIVWSLPEPWLLGFRGFHWPSAQPAITRPTFHAFFPAMSKSGQTNCIACLHPELLWNCKVITAAKLWFKFQLSLGLSSHTVGFLLDGPQMLADKWLQTLISFTSQQTTFTGRCLEWRRTAEDYMTFSNG